MQKYNEEYSNTILEDIEKITRIISSKLNTKENENNADIENINYLFTQRRIKLDELNEWFLTDSAKEYIDSKAEYWNKRINNIIVNDKNNIKLIEQNKNTTENKLRDLLKKKSLLIYMK